MATEEHAGLTGHADLDAIASSDPAMRAFFNRALTLETMDLVDVDCDVAVRFLAGEVFKHLAPTYYVHDVFTEELGVRSGMANCACTFARGCLGRLRSGAPQLLENLRRLRARARGDRNEDASLFVFAPPCSTTPLASDVPERVRELYIRTLVAATALALPPGQCTQHAFRTAIDVTQTSAVWGDTTHCSEFDALLLV